MLAVLRRCRQLSISMVRVSYVLRVTLACLVHRLVYTAAGYWESESAIIHTEDVVDSFAHASPFAQAHEAVLDE